MAYRKKSNPVTFETVLGIALSLPDVEEKDPAYATPELWAWMFAQKRY